MAKEVFFLDFDKDNDDFLHGKKSKKKKKASLRKQLIKLAHNNKRLREDILNLLSEE